MAHLAAAMPVAYMEPHLNEFNAFSVYTTKTPRERASECDALLFIYSDLFFLSAEKTEKLLFNTSPVKSFGPSK